MSSHKFKPVINTHTQRWMHQCAPKRHPSKYTNGVGGGIEYGHFVQQGSKLLLVFNTSLIPEFQWYSYVQTWNRIMKMYTNNLQRFGIKTSKLALLCRIFHLFVWQQGVLIFNWPQHAVWMHSHSHSHETHMNASREKALWHILTCWLETVLISESEIQRQRHTAGEREGILSHRLQSRPHYSYKIHSKAL